MKFVKIVLASVVLLLFCSAFVMKKNKSVYMFGISASFTDTIVYYTDVQLLDSVHLDKKGFLPYREHYSYQLKNYLEYEKGEKNRTCMIYFSNNESKLHAERKKLLSRYNKDKTVEMKEVKQNEFLFKKPEN